MKGILKGWVACTGAAALAASIAWTSGAHAADKKFKIFLSMSYIGNDWQAEAANMVKAMAAHKDFADKVDLQVQVAGPNAQRQIQQINAMVQQGAQAIIVYPISPTALNNAVKNACDKGVMIIAYDAQITEPCAYNVSIDQEEAGRTTAEWLAKKLNGKGDIVMITGVPGTSVDTLRTKAAKEVFAKYPDIKIVDEAVGMWSQAVARTELSKIFSRPAIGIRSTAFGCRSAATRRTPCRSRRARSRISSNPAPEKAPTAAVSRCFPQERRSKAPTEPMRPWAPPDLVRFAPLCRRLCAEARGRKARRQRHPETHHLAAAARHQRDDQVLQGGNMGRDEGGLQRVPAGARAQSGMVRLDLFARDAGDRIAGRARGPA